MPIETVNVFDKNGNEKFQPTQDEIRVISEKMKDPEFAKLMHEYMQSLSDPETRKEEEEYLKQMEREAKEGGDYSFDFIFPKPGFVVELKQTYGYKKNQRVFVNVCESDRVDEFREETTGNRMGSNWHVPVAVSQERDEEHEGATVAVYDAVFHPKTRGLADRSDRFLCFLVEIAVEHINAGYKTTFGFEFSRLSSSIPCIGTPKNQTVRKEKGKSAFPLSSEPVSTAPIKPSLAAVAPTKKATAAPKAPPRDAHLPKFSVMHQGELDIQDAWQWKIVDKRVGIPDKLIVKMEFPGVTSAAHLDIDVAGAYIELAKSTKHAFYGTIPLPFSVEEAPLSAKFDKSKQLLSLTLKVVPPQRPPSMITADDMLKAQSKASTGEEPATTSSAEVVDPAEAVAAAPDAGAVPIEAQEAELTETKDEPQPTVATMPTSPEAAAQQSRPPSSEVQETNPVEVSAVPPAAAQAAPSAAPPAVESSHLDSDRASQLMSKLQEARREREAAEAAEASGQQPAEVVPDSEEKPEVIDLRKKQEEWMSSMKKEQQEQEERRRAAEEEQDRFADEELRKQQREARRKLEIEKEAERMEAAFKQKQLELPLKSRYIFDIDA